MNKKGFTLVELLITIALIGVIGMVIVLSMVSINKTTKDNEFKRFRDKVISAARTYSDINSDAFNDLYIDKAYLYIEVGTLIEEGLLDYELKNPYTNERIDPKEKIKVTLDDITGALKFVYPVGDDEESEQSLVALSDFVVPGESFNCETGVGTYLLALYDEDGRIIPLNDENKTKYSFDCYYKKAGTKIFKETKPGDYEITYTWKTASGNNRRRSRIIKVISPPTLNIDYNNSYTKGSIFNVKFDGSKWNYLSFKPRVEGIDYSLLSLNILVGDNEYILPNTNASTFLNWEEYLNTVKVKHAELVRKFINNDKYYDEGYLPVYDGDYTYTINIRMQGHYDKNYYYNPYSNNTNANKFEVKERVTIPDTMITNKSITPYEVKYLESDYLTKKHFEINKDNIFTIKGGISFEYTYGNKSNEEKAYSMTSNSNTFDIFSIYTDKKDVKTYENAYFRVVNSQGKKGEWTSKVLRITNQLALLLKAGSNETIHCSEGPLKNGDSYYFCDKNEKTKNNIAYKNIDLVVLTIRKDNSLTVTFDTPIMNDLTTDSLKFTRVTNKKDDKFFLLPTSALDYYTYKILYNDGKYNKLMNGSLILTGSGSATFYNPDKTSAGKFTNAINSNTNLFVKDQISNQDLTAYYKDIKAVTFTETHNTNSFESISSSSVKTNYNLHCPTESEAEAVAEEECSHLKEVEKDEEKEKGEEETEEEYQERLRKAEEEYQERVKRAEEEYDMCFKEMKENYLNKTDAMCSINSPLLVYNSGVPVNNFNEATASVNPMIFLRSNAFVISGDGTPGYKYELGNN